MKQLMKSMMLLMFVILAVGSCQTNLLSPDDINSRPAIITELRNPGLPPMESQIPKCGDQSLKTTFWWNEPDLKVGYSYGTLFGLRIYPGTLSHSGPTEYNNFIVTMYLAYTGVTTTIIDNVRELTTEGVNLNYPNGYYTTWANFPNGFAIQYTPPIYIPGDCAYAGTAVQFVLRVDGEVCQVFNTTIGWSRCVDPCATPCTSACPEYPNCPY